MSNSVTVEIPLKPFIDRLKGFFKNAVDETLFDHIVPPLRLPVCALCQSDASKYSLCAKCGWQRYCSKTCQVNDWPEHKKACRKNHRIDLTSFQGFIACLGDTCMETETEQNVNLFAMHDVLNKPDSNMQPTVFPDGYTAKVVQLGEILDIAREPWKAPSNDLARWWPQGLNDQERMRLLRRFQNDISPLKLHLSVALALLAELYMHPKDSHEPLTTLRVMTSPITDFGLVSGSCPGSPNHCYSFHYQDGRVERGAHPDQHVWMYFVTADGKEYYLDMSLNLFGLGTYIDAQQFWKNQGEPFTHISDFVGMFWFDKRLYPENFCFYEEKRRLSIMRSSTMPQIARYLKAEWTDSPGTYPKRLIIMNIMSFAYLLTGRELLSGDALVTLRWALRSMRRMRTMLSAQLWRTWPENPTVLAVDGGIGPGIPMNPLDEEEFIERAKRFAERSRRVTSRERKKDQ